MTGKAIRLQRIFKHGKILCVALDHGITTGPTHGLIDMQRTLQACQRGGASAILTHKGIVSSLSRFPNIGLIVHLSASTAIGPAPNHKVLITAPEAAVALGADLVSVHINIGAREEPEMLRDLGRVADRCLSLGVPLMAMMYVRREDGAHGDDPKLITHAARIGAEAGADIVKIQAPNPIAALADVVASCPCPVVIAGGPRIEPSDTLILGHSAMQAGATGLSFGRSIYEHSNPEFMVAALASIVYKGASPSQAQEVLNRRDQGISGE